MRLLLFDIDISIAKALQDRFSSHADVTVMHSPLEQIPPVDALITPGNAFGIMDGGFDLVVRNLYGTRVEKAVQEAIAQEHCGLLAIGSAVSVPLSSSQHLIYAPTMLIPQTIRGTINVYLAMLASLHTATALLESDSLVACPGLGTLTGGLSPEEASAQMELAYRHFQEGGGELDWISVMRRIEEIGMTVITLETEEAN